MVAFTVMLTAGLLVQYNQAVVRADQYDEQIKAIQGEVDEYNRRAAELGAQADTLQNKVNELANQAATIQAQIDLSQARYDMLIERIKQTEKEIAETEDTLGYVIVDKSMSDKITPLERLASSGSLSKYIDEETQRNAISDSLADMITQIEDLQKQLQKQKKEVEQVLADQKKQKEDLAAKQAEQQQLLDSTRGNEDIYRQMVANGNSRISEIREAQRKAYLDATGGGKNSSGTFGTGFSYRNYSGEQGCGGGYGYCAGGLDYTIDAWQLYARECVSWAAWRAYHGYGKHVTGFMGMGNARQWPSTASTYMGATVNSTPAPGAVAISYPMYSGDPYGHAMVVEQVLGDGWVRVSQYNFAVNGQYSTMEIKASSAAYVHFRNR